MADAHAHALFPSISSEDETCSSGGMKVNARELHVSSYQTGLIKPHYNIRVLQ